VNHSQSYSIFDTVCINFEIPHCINKEQPTVTLSGIDMINDGINDIDKDRRNNPR